MQVLSYLQHLMCSGLSGVFLLHVELLFPNSGVVILSCYLQILELSLIAQQLLSPDSQSAEHMLASSTSVRALLTLASVELLACVW